MDNYLSDYNASSGVMPEAPINDKSTYLAYLGYKDNFWNRMLYAGGSNQQAWADARNAQYQQALAQYNNWYNSDAQVMARRAAAGINPYFNGGNGSGSSASASPISYNPQSNPLQDSQIALQGANTTQNLLGQIFNTVGLFKTMKKQDADIANSEAQNKLITQQANSQLLSNIIRAYMTFGKDTGSNIFDFSGDLNAGIIPQINPDSPVAQDINNKLLLQGFDIKESENYNTKIIPFMNQMNEYAQTVAKLSTEQQQKMNDYFNNWYLPNLLLKGELDQQQIKQSLKWLKADKWIDTISKCLAGGQSFIHMLSPFINNKTTPVVHSRTRSYADGDGVFLGGYTDTYE